MGSSGRIGIREIFLYSVGKMETTLILNMDYSILTKLSWQKGITLLLKGAIVPIEFHERRIFGANGEYYPLPKVAMVKKFISFTYKAGPSRRNIFLRDDYTCQYCGIKNPDKLTLDHVKPKWRGGKDTWENLVCACFKCNSKKGGRTPEEANMPLLNQPKEGGGRQYYR
jgi:5-methylcytosine-specific restriction endonuclease McrA